MSPTSWRRTTGPVAQPTVRASLADTMGNAVSDTSTRNFNPLAAMAGRITIVEAERVVAPGQIDPAGVHLPGIFVQRVLALGPEDVTAKRIVRRTTRRPEHVAEGRS